MMTRNRVGLAVSVYSLTGATFHDVTILGRGDDVGCRHPLFPHYVGVVVRSGALVVVYRSRDNRWHLCSLHGGRLSVFPGRRRVRFGFRA